MPKKVVIEQDGFVNFRYKEATDPHQDDPSTQYWPQQKAQQV